MGKYIGSQKRVKRSETKQFAGDYGSFTFCDKRPSLFAPTYLRTAGLRNPVSSSILLK